MQRAAGKGSGIGSAASPSGVMQVQAVQVQAVQVQAVQGNCGVGIAPCGPRLAAYVLAAHMFATYLLSRSGMTATRLKIGARQRIAAWTRDTFSKRGPARAASLGLVILSGVALAGALMPEEERAPPRPHTTARGDGAPGLASYSPATQQPTPSAGESGSPANPIGLRALPENAAWTMVRSPIAMFNLEGPETDAAELTYQVFAQGRFARQDRLTWVARPGGHGTMTRPVMTRPMIELTIERFERAAPGYRSLFADIARRAAEMGISIEKMSAAGEVATKFGGLEVADAILASEKGRLACLVYRRVDTVGLTIAGWYCGSGARPADRIGLGCFLDRLDLMRAGQDHALKKYFAAAERARHGCASARQSGRKSTWLDHEAAFPPLKLSANRR